MKNNSLSLMRMIMMRMIILIVLAILTGKGTLYAQGSQSLPSASSPVRQSEASDSSTKTPEIQKITAQEPVNLEVAILKAQLEVMRQYDQRLLNTVYWALGGIASTLILIIGLGWYTNFRLHKKEIEDLKNDYSRDIESLKNRYSSYLEDIKTQYQEGLRSLEKELKVSITKDLKAALESKINGIAIDVKNQKLDSLDMQIYQAKQQNIEHRVIDYYLQATELAVQIRDWDVTELIDGLDDYLSEKIKNKKKLYISATTVSEYHTRLAKLPNQYSKAIESIRRKLSFYED